MKRIKSILAVALFAFALVCAIAPTPAVATTYYLDVTTGNDGDDGLSEGNAKATHGGIIAIPIAAGDLIYVKGSADYVVEQGSTDAVLQLSITGAFNTPIRWEGYALTPGDNGLATLDANTNTLANCVNFTGTPTHNVFANHRFTGGSSDGVNLNGPDNFVFANCRFDNNGGAGVNLDNNSSFYRCAADNNTGVGFDCDSYSNIVACLAYSNGGDGIVNASIGAVVYCLSYENTGNQMATGIGTSVYVNNTVDGDNTDDGIVAAWFANILVNNIFYDCDDALVGTSGAQNGNFGDYNLFFSNTDDYTFFTAGANDVSGDPVFVGPPDYSLDTGSPALEAGVDVGVIDGITSTSFVDIGAQQAESTGGTTVIVIDD